MFKAEMELYYTTKHTSGQGPTLAEQKKTKKRTRNRSSHAVCRGHAGLWSRIKQWSGGPDDRCDHI